MQIFNTRDQYGEYVIKGKLLGVTYEVMRAGIMVFSKELDLRDAPYQINNMLAWAQAVNKDYGDGALSRNLGATLRQGRGLRFEMNDGRGRLKGREASNNVLKCWISDVLSDPDKVDRDKWMLSIRIRTVSHSSLYQKEIREGIRIAPGQRPEALREKQYREELIPFFNSRGEIVMPQPKGSFIAEFNYSPTQHDEFYDEFPEWKGKVKSLTSD